MSKQVSLPDQIFAEVQLAANQAQIPVEDFVAGALTDQLAVQARIAQRAARSKESEFLWALAQAPDAPPLARD